ncbi:kinase-like domain-containing protein [Mycena filopes]|nr:kinase-like domain-containing protein [Mycena filopes]
MVDNFSDLAPSDATDSLTSEPVSSNSDSGSEYDKDDFPELDPGHYDPESGRWRKPVSPHEQNAYEALSPHHRILKFHGVTDEDYLDLDFHPNGDLWTYLVQQKPPLATRIDWALEIAEGLAHMHSQFVIWADAHFRNILITEDHHVVLADFAYSIIMRPNLDWPVHYFSTTPPPVFAAPLGYWGSPSNTYVDIFGFGVMLFALLMNRFPWTDTLTPSLDEQARVMDTHALNKFDVLDEKLSGLATFFAPILNKCFHVAYMTGTELLEDLKLARESWITSERAPAE